MDLPGAFLLPGEDEGPAHGERAECTSSKTLASVEFSLSWQSAEAAHTDVFALTNLNLWRDWMPPELEALLLDKPVGPVGTLALLPGVLIPAAEPRDVLEIPHARFNRRYRQHSEVQPIAGRFYPKGFIAGVRDVYSEDLTPFRIGAVDADRLTVDLGHPLAGREMTLSAQILDIRAVGSERGGRAQDVPQRVAGSGPGMQARWQGRPTDFFSGEPFARDLGDDDAVFYAKPRFVDHLDRTALRQLARLYARLLPESAQVLDLMASVNSHLEDIPGLGNVTGLGMNADELAANDRLAHRVVYDLNRDPELPFDDASFDAVICSVSVEYLIRPFEVFASVAHVLKPGGKFIVAFSNRWFPPKSIRIWEALHPFERMGLVLEYFLHTGRFTRLQTFSLAGLPRPGDDKYADRMQWSDPLYAVWGEVSQ